LLIDMEHGHGDYQTLLAQLQALQGSRAAPLVRVQWNDPAVVKRVLDLGAYGVMIPWVSGRESCQAAVRACKYPPDGIRGMAGSHRAAGFGRHGADYWKRANAEVLVIIQIETPEAVAEIDAMLAIPGVDVAFIGPTDLAAALGHVGDPKHADVVVAIAAIESAAKRAGVALGTISRNWEEAKALYDRGYQMVTIASDAALVVQHAAALVKRFRDEVPAG
ncbi:MAG: 2,4-dihydroxyhept-2-ene-1,7-dioic acid aldolase, partial [Candidatus Rokubacteria bacterium]|nr:2,4-dihydroxyhept-2-ene-1,7-dioic acid aldolase [Candidatus Rokubacteria bacterium]